MLPRLHLITDDAVLRDARFVPHAEAVCVRCGADVALHLRGHDTGGGALYAIGERLAAAAARSGTWLFVNDRVDVALAIGAQRVQLGVRSLPIADARSLLGRDARIGYSVHSALEATRASVEGADFVVAGTIFASASHTPRVPAGSALVRECVAGARVPVIAIGGVTLDRIAELAAAQSYGVAVLSAVWHAEDPAAAAAQFVRVVRRELVAAVEE